MLMGHSRLFAPPELHLLPFTDMGERDEILQQQGKTFLGEGLIQTLAHLDQLTPAAAQALVAQWIADKRPITAIYAELQSRLNGQSLIDKSPSYAHSEAILHRAEELEPKPYYIQLIRHPLAMAGSFVENRFHRLFAAESEQQGAWPQAFALWAEYNAHLHHFLDSIPPQRVFTIYFEDLVAHPKAVMEQLCEGLGIAFEPALLEPYREDRLTQGLHPQSLPIGDPNFHRHQTIEAERAQIPDHYHAHLAEMSPAGREEAATWGYPLPLEPYPLAPAQALFLAHADPLPYLLIQHRLWHERIDEDRLRLAWRQLLRRHAVLRHTFWRQQGRWWQQPAMAIHPIFEVVHATADESVGDLRQRLVAQLRQPLDLATGAMAACGLAWHDSQRVTVTLVVHHLVADGLSLAVLGRDLLALYRQPNRHRQAADLRFAHAAQRLAARTLSAAELADWQQQIAVPLQLPQSGEGGDGEGNNTAGREATLEQRFTFEELGLAALSASARHRHLLAALYRVVAAWSGQTSIVLALRRQGRTPTEGIDESVGWFACDLPLRVEVDEVQGDLHPLSERLAAQLQTLPAEESSYLLGHLAGELPPLHQVTGLCFNYQPQALFAVAPELAETTTELWADPSWPRPYLIDWIVRETATDRLQVILRYAPAIHSPQTITQLLAEWQAQLQPLG